MNFAPYILVVRAPGTHLSDQLEIFVKDLAASPNLAALLELDGVTLFGEPRAPHLVLTNGGGLIWGRLFDRMTSAPVVAVGCASEPIERWVERYWGGYLAIRIAAGAVEICRDPSGSIPCYHARIDDADIFASRPGVIFDAGLLRPEFDWTVIAQALIYRDLRPARTALRGVSELMPGTCATLVADGIRLSTIWSPWRYASPEMEIGLKDEAVERVRRVVTSCVGAWGRSYQRPLIELSGGLDSSIVAAVLSQTNAEALCVTFGAVEGDPDETPYARAAAEHLGLPLEILRPDIRDVDLTYTHARDLPRPSARAFAQAHDFQLREAAGRHDADAFFSGGGGDNVFAYLQSVLPVIDRWKRRGGGLLGTVGDVANIAEVSLWQALAASVRRGLRPRPARQWMSSDRFIARAALGNLPFPHGHPWSEVPPTMLPGKRVHGNAMIVIQNHLEGFDRLHDAPIISPLISQPVVETCMAIPTWLWCDGGVNRAVARSAFAKRLPSVVIERRTKGAFDAYCARVYDANRGVIREMLRGGALARQGLIDTDEIELTLARGEVSRPDMLRLLDLIDVEAWIDAWTTRVSAVRAP